MDHMELYVSTAEEMHEVGSALGECLEDGDAVLLVGDLGAGKTQFAQGVGEGLGISEPLTSPTFNLVFEYHDGRSPLYHFDLYRLESEFDLEDIDFYELTDRDTPGAALVEWADMFPKEMPEDALNVEILNNGDEIREVTVTAMGTRSQSLLDRWESSLS